MLAQVRLERHVGLKRPEGSVGERLPGRARCGRGRRVERVGMHDHSGTGAGHLVQPKFSKRIVVGVMVHKGMLSRPGRVCTSEGAAECHALHMLLSTSKGRAVWICERDVPLTDIFLPSFLLRLGLGLCTSACFLLVFTHDELRLVADRVRRDSELTCPTSSSGLLLGASARRLLLVLLLFPLLALISITIERSKVELCLYLSAPCLTDRETRLWAG